MSPQCRRVATWLTGGAALAILILGLAIHQWRPGQPSRPLRIGVSHNPPYTVKTADGRWKGIAAETVAEAARRLGYPVKWIEVRLPDGNPAPILESGRVDLWPLMSPEAVETEKVHLTAPWVTAWYYLVALQPSGIVRLEHLRGKAVAVHAQRPTLNRLLSGTRPIWVASSEQALAAVCGGSASATVLETRGMQAVLLEQLRECLGLRLRVVPIPESSMALGVGSTAQAARWADAIRAEISGMAQDGSLEGIFTNWMLVTSKEAEAIHELAMARRRIYWMAGAAVAMGLVALMLMWQYRRVRDARLAAEHASRAKSEFLANMSHEIRTPINGIMGLSRLMVDPEFAGDPRESAGTILESTHSLLAIIDDVLDFSRIESGKLRVAPVDVLLRPVLKKALAVAEANARSKGIGFRVLVSEAVPDAVVVDPVRVGQVLGNLAGNAVKFTAAGEVRVDVSVDDDELAFEVSDTGLGIAAGTLKRLFRPFTQADASTTRLFGGTGLGLAISKRLVELMGGRIGVVSREGRGSRFWFRIPLVKGDATETAPESLPVPRRAEVPRNVLVAEDNPVNQRVVVAFLKRLGHTATVVASGADAVDEACRRQYDLILMDCHMPGMDGYQATREIQQRLGSDAGPPILAVTAHAVQGAREQCAEAGMHDYLSKPIRLEELQAAIEKWGRVRV